MKKSILFGVLLIIVTLLSSCNNSERYHFSHSANSYFVSDSKTGKVYSLIGLKLELTWDPIKKTITWDTIKRTITWDTIKKIKNLSDKLENQPQLENKIKSDKKKTVAELGQFAKKQFPDDYKDMDDVSAGQQVLMEYPEYKDKVEGNITPLSPAPQYGKLISENNFERLVKDLYTTFKKDLTPEKLQYINTHYGNGKEMDFVRNFYTTYNIPLTPKKMDYIQSHYLKKKPFGSGYQFPLPGSSQEKDNANRGK